MKAKDKAKELVDRFLRIEGADDCGNSYSYVAKQCALICVDEILNAPQIGSGWLHKYKPYWKQVKQEINKL
jgi:hypothetical protein